MTRLFKKTWRVVVAAQPQEGFVGDNPDFFETIGNAVEIASDETSDGNRVVFSVQKTLSKEPNKCTLDIYNLSPNTRDFLNRTPVQVSLQAGYDGAPRLLFMGDLRPGSHTKREGTSLVTHLEIRDGMRAYAHARVSRSYKPPIRVVDVLSDCAKSMGLQLPRELDQSTELREALASGISMHGPTREVLSHLLAPYGYGWSIQSGTLVIIPDGEPRQGEAYLINQESGLINSPQRATSDKESQKLPVTWETLLYPELEPARLAKLESEFISGVFRVKEVGHDGDSHDDGGWTTSCKGDPT